jgi:hypothetical protein
MFMRVNNHNTSRVFGVAWYIIIFIMYEQYRFTFYFKLAILVVSAYLIVDLHDNRITRVNLVYCFINSGNFWNIVYSLYIVYIHIKAVYSVSFLLCCSIIKTYSTSAPSSVIVQVSLDTPAKVNGL